jgi:predicted kinase
VLPTDLINMAKMTIMVGLPASGKSTRAKEIVEQTGNTVRLNKDLLRTMLHFDKFSGHNEGITKDVSRILAKQLLAQGVNVIIDDTNLNPGTVQGWKDLAKELDAKIEYERIDSDVETCLLRDSQREKKVGAHIIKKMALQYLEYLKGEKAVICDLDGTLCNLDHRLHFTQSDPKDWKGFFNGIPDDSLREDVRNSILKIYDEHQNTFLILVSARPEMYREATEEWLKKNNIFYQALIMRETNDKRPDTEVKADVYEKYLKNLNIIKVFDDRPSVIRMWREKGLEVEDVGKGIEF